MEECRARACQFKNRFGSAHIIMTCGCARCRAPLPSSIRDSMGLTLFALPYIPLHDVTPPFNPFRKYGCWVGCQQKKAPLDDTSIRTYSENARLIPTLELSQNQLSPTSWKSPKNFIIPAHIYNSIFSKMIDISFNFVAPIPPQKNLESAVSFLLGKQWTRQETARDKRIEIINGRETCGIPNCYQMTNILVSHYYDSL